MTAGPYEPTGAYRGDHLRRWIQTAGEWKAEAVRLAGVNRTYRERLEAAYAVMTPEQKAAMRRTA